MKDISIAIPIFNEEKNIPLLLPRLLTVLDSMKRPYEIIFVDDGSRDGSLRLLKKAAEQYPGRIHVIGLSRNIGQHQALLIAFKSVQGRHIVTLDADLQNPPEEIPKILAKLDAGHDVVGGIRMNRQDTLFRKTASRLVNRITSLITHLDLQDCGCMLRGYSHDVVEKIVACDKRSAFIPARALLFARNPIDIPVAHASRAEGESKYSLTKLVRLNFDVMLGFSASGRKAL